MKIRNIKALAELNKKANAPISARTLRRLIKDEDFLNEQPAAQARIKECYNPPDFLDKLMTVLDGMLDGYGVEYIATARDGFRASEQHGISYVNMGDTYALTACYDHDTDTLWFTCWGNLVEHKPSKYI